MGYTVEHVDDVVIVRVIGEVLDDDAPRYNDLKKLVERDYPMIWDFTDAKYFGGVLLSTMGKLYTAAKTRGRFVLCGLSGNGTGKVGDGETDARHDVWRRVSK